MANSSVLALKYKDALLTQCNKIFHSIMLEQERIT